jgi:hypothetical protein
VPSIFSRGVVRRSDQLRQILELLADAIHQMEAKVDLAGFDSRHPGTLSESINDLKEARKHIFRVIERLNFPDKFKDSQPVP